MKSPWDTYTALRPLQRGGEVTYSTTRRADLVVDRLRPLGKFCEAGSASGKGATRKVNHEPGL